MVGVYSRKLLPVGTEKRDILLLIGLYGHEAEVGFQPIANRLADESAAVVCSRHVGPGIDDREIEFSVRGAHVFLNILSHTWRSFLGDWKATTMLQEKAPAWSALRPCRGSLLC